MREKKSSYTVMFVPDGKGRTFYIRLNKRIVFSVVFFLVILVSGSTFLIVKSGLIGAKLQHIHSLRNENKRLSEENQKLHEIVSKIEFIERTNTYINRLVTAVGEKGFVNPLKKASLIVDEKLFVEDSLDSVASDRRVEMSEEYKSTSVLSASREEISLSIPNISPVGGWVTKEFINNKSDPVLNHLGVDFSAKTGMPIRATAPGIVESVVTDTYFGLLVTVRHKFGFVTRFGHCSQALVSKGDNVERGRTIALVGNTGRSSAPHLHYEVIKDGKHVNPLKFTFDRFD
jgi:murein DD-endopeptidase MepM/ murein hydrolase activator NlpD